MQNVTQSIISAASQIILGKEAQIRMALACILARGHLLIEDLPGMGKTTLAHTLAQVLGLDFRRVQFTSDLLPADILGVSVYDPTAPRSSSIPARYSPTSYWRTRSTAPLPRRRAPCWK
jgi:MoxR-like ATPase